MAKRNMYDVIVVGARCAGSATATLLARHGHSVLLLDAATFPTDFQDSTHLLWQSGVARLARWGLLDRLKATGCPPIRKITLDLGVMSLEGNARPADGAHDAFCPRRIVLDGLLQDAAREAGVEFVSGAHVRDLAWTDGRVSGVSWTDAGGTAQHAGSRMVVGADGANSTVARLVNAPVAEEHPRLEGVIWSYFDGIPDDGMEFYARPRRMMMVYPTNDGQSLVGSCVHQEDYPALARDADAQMRAEMQTFAPSLAARLQAATQIGPWLTRSVKGFRRQATGPGWALVGDAGVTMDPITAAGITNAFRDADLLSAAIHAGITSGATCDQVVGGFGGERDAVSVPLFQFARESARLEPPPPQIMALFAAMPGQQSAIDDYFGVFAQTVPVTTFFSEANVTKILANAGQTGRS